MLYSSQWSSLAILLVAPLHTNSLTYDVLYFSHCLILADLLVAPLHTNSLILVNVLHFSQCYRIAAPLVAPPQSYLLVHMLYFSQCLSSAAPLVAPPHTNNEPLHCTMPWSNLSCNMGGRLTILSRSGWKQWDEFIAVAPEKQYIHVMRPFLI